MAADLVQSTGRRYDILLEMFRKEKGAEYTEALAVAVPKLSGERQRKVRDALSERVKRMKETTLKQYLSDENLEIRAAAAAVALKGSKTLIPDLIPLVRDTHGGVADAAHQGVQGSQWTRLRSQIRRQPRRANASVAAMERVVEKAGK